MKLRALKFGTQIIQVIWKISRVKMFDSSQNFEKIAPFKKPATIFKCGKYLNLELTKIYYTQYLFKTQRISYCVPNMNKIGAKFEKIYYIKIQHMEKSVTVVVVPIVKTGLFDTLKVKTHG